MKEFCFIFLVNEKNLSHFPLIAIVSENKEKYLQLKSCIIQYGLPEEGLDLKITKLLSSLFKRQNKSVDHGLSVYI